MARPVSQPGRALFKSKSYMESWATNNAYYAGNIGYSYTMGNTYTNAVVRSGVVNVGGYTGTPDPKAANIASNRAMVTSKRGAPFDMMFNPTKQRGSLPLGQVLMGGYQFPGQAFAPKQVDYGVWVANPLSMWMQGLGAGGTSYNYLRQRKLGPENQDKGWQTTLTTAQKYSGTGKSSIYQGVERYSTQETRLGKNITEDPNSGFKALDKHSSSQHYIPELSQMYKETNPNIGFARRNI